MTLFSVKTFYAKYRSLFALGTAALLAELAYAILNLSALPVYVKFSLHQEQFWGMILGTFLLTEAVSRPAFGALGDKIGRKPMMMAGPAITCITSYLTIVYQGPYVIFYLIALRAIDGLGSGALWPSAFATIGDLTEEENRSTAMSVLNVTYMSGLALGFLMGGAVNDYFGTYTASFYLVSILLAMSVVVMFFFLPKNIGAGVMEPLHGEPLEIPTIEAPTRFKFSDLWRSFRAVPEMITLACVTFLGMGMLTPIVKLYALEHLGMTETQFGLLVAPIAAAMGVFAVPMGRMGDKYGKCTAVCWGLLASAAAMWILALFRSVTLAGVAGVAIGLGFTMAFPAWNALVMSVTAPERRGEVIGAVGLAQGLACIVGTVFGALVYGSDVLSFPRLGVVNYNVPFWFSAILLTAGTVMAFTWIRGLHCHRDPGKGITIFQRNLVLAVSAVGLICLIAWIGFRYASPAAPDRVAWGWVQQLVRGKPEKAVKYTLAQGRDGWNGREASRSYSRKYHSWKRQSKARYIVEYAQDLAPDRVEVPVRFVLENRLVHEERVILCKLPSGEWRVCGVRSGPDSRAPVAN